MKTIFLKQLSLLFFVEIALGWEAFWGGRRYGGNIGDPDEDSTTNSIRTRNTISDNWITQMLDHFDPTNNATWQQRYFVNGEFFKPNGPVFLLIGGEGEASPGWMQSGAWLKYAEKFGALCFQLEHRYYGKSLPTVDLSTQNLRFLSSEQALSDLGYFVTKMNGQYNLTDTNKWIAFGGSYSGSLAAWLRKKFSHLVYGAISSSAPLLAKIDFSDYYMVVKDSLATYKQCDCVNEVRTAFQQLTELILVPSGQKTLSQMLKFCDTFKGSLSSLDISTIFDRLSDVFAIAAQFNSAQKVTINGVCDKMCNGTAKSALMRLVDLNFNSQNCFQYSYTEIVKKKQDASRKLAGERQWFYQTCTEFGFYQTSSNSSSIFGDKVPVSYFTQLCSDVFGQAFNQRMLTNAVEQTNVFYGGLKPATTNVLYTHGSLDPWHALGLTRTDKTQLRPTIYISGTAHCADMHEPKPEDLPSLKTARETTVSFLQNLLKN